MFSLTKFVATIFLRDQNLDWVRLTFVQAFVARDFWSVTGRVYSEFLLRNIVISIRKTENCLIFGAR